MPEGEKKGTIFERKKEKFNMKPIYIVTWREDEDSRVSKVFKNRQSARRFALKMRDLYNSAVILDTVSRDNVIKSEEIQKN